MLCAPYIVKYEYNGNVYNMFGNFGRNSIKESFDKMI